MQPGFGWGCCLLLLSHICGGPDMRATHMCVTIEQRTHNIATMCNVMQFKHVTFHVEVCNMCMDRTNMYA